MKKYSSLLIIIAAVFLTRCSSRYILIRSNKYHFPLNHSKIMTDAVINDDSDSIQTRIKKSITAKPRPMGYDALSAHDELGPKGVGQLYQQDTCLKLCSQGID